MFQLQNDCYVRLLSLDAPQKRDFYEEETRRAGWSVRQLDRQIDAMLHALCSMLLCRHATRLRALPSSRKAGLRAGRRSAPARRHGHGHVFVLGFMIRNGLFVF